jgi:hypothetical protein
MDILPASEKWGFNATLNLERNPMVLEPFAAQSIPFERRIEYGRPDQDPSRTVPFTVPEGAKGTTVELLVTGHGFWSAGDPKDVGEFGQRSNSVFVDGELVELKQIWRDDCGDPHGVWSGKPLQPNLQHGNYARSRAGWCPGDVVRPWHLDLGALSPGEHTLTWTPEPYVNEAPNPDANNPYWSFSGIVSHRR